MSQDRPIPNDQNTLAQRQARRDASLARLREVGRQEGVSDALIAETEASIRSAFMVSEMFNWLFDGSVTPRSTETVLDLDTVAITKTQPASSEAIARGEAADQETARAAAEYKLYRRQKQNGAGLSGVYFDYSAGPCMGEKGEYWNIEAYAPTREELDALIADFVSRHAAYEPRFFSGNAKDGGYGLGFTAQGQCYRYEVA